MNAPVTAPQGVRQQGDGSGGCGLGARRATARVAMARLMQEARARRSMSRELRVVGRCQRKGRIRERGSREEKIGVLSLCARRCSTESLWGWRGLWAKWPACPCSWVSCGSRRHEVSTSCGRDGRGWTAHAQGGTHALEEKEERDGSMSMPCNDVIQIGRASCRERV